MPKLKPGQKLTTRERRFIHEYLEDLNQTQAAIRAGYSPRSARVIASQLMKKPRVQRALEEKLQQLDQANEQGISRVIRELKAIAYIDPRDIISWEGNTVELVDSAELPPHVAGAIKSVEETEDGRIRLRLYNKLEALEKLGKYYKMWRPPRQTESQAAGAGMSFTFVMGERSLPRQGDVPEAALPGGREIRLEEGDARQEVRGLLVEHGMDPDQARKVAAELEERFDVDDRDDDDEDDD